MDKTSKPTQDQLRKAQDQMNALNLAYEYFYPVTPSGSKTSAHEYFEYVEAA